MIAVKTRPITVAETLAFALRWACSGRGKRGGTRVVYFYYRPDCPLYLLLAYAKAQASDLSADEKKAVAAFAAVIKATVD